MPVIKTGPAPAARKISLGGRRCSLSARCSTSMRPVRRRTAKSQAPRRFRRRIGLRTSSTNSATANIEMIVSHTQDPPTDSNCSRFAVTLRMPNPKPSKTAPRCRLDETAAATTGLPLRMVRVGGAIPRYLEQRRPCLAPSKALRQNPDNVATAHAAHLLAIGSISRALNAASPLADGVPIGGPRSSWFFGMVPAGWPATPATWWQRYRRQDPLAASRAAVAAS
jgi:hypothetical protein